MVDLKDRVEEVDIDKIDYFYKRKHDKGRIKELAESIEKYGLIVPITVRKEKSGDYKLCKGQGRLEALDYLGKKKIRAFVYNQNEVDDKTMIKWWLIENEVREQLSAEDKARLMAIDYDLLGEAEAAKKHKVTPATLRLYKKTIDKTTPRMEKQVKSGKVSFTILKETLSAIKDSKSAEEVIDYIGDGSLNFDESRAAIEMARKLSRENKTITVRELKNRFSELSDENKTLRPIIADLKIKYEFLKEWLSELLNDRSFVALLKKHDHKIPKQMLNLNMED